jgi:hypothetical protein
MAQDLATITANLKAAYPTLAQTVNGATSTLTQTQYDARIAEMAQAELDRQVAADTAATQKALRDQVRTARTRLQQIRDATPGTATNVQRDQAISDIANYLDKLIGALIDRGIVELS